MDAKKANDLLSRLDERTGNFQKSLDFLAQENRDGINRVIAALEKHASDDIRRFEKGEIEFDKHDSRLKILENWRWYILGAIAVAGVVIWFLKG